MLLWAATSNWVSPVSPVIPVIPVIPVSPVSPLSPVSPVSLAHLWVLFGVIGTEVLTVAHRYGELVASHPWKAIIACLAITIAGGSGLLRSILEKSNIEYWRNMEEILMTLVWTSQGNIGRKNQLKNKPIIHLFCLGFMKKATQPAWSYQEDRNSEKISTGRMKISQER